MDERSIVARLVAHRSRVEEPVADQATAVTEAEGDVTGRRLAGSFSGIAQMSDVDGLTLHREEVGLQATRAASTSDVELRSFKKLQRLGLLSNCLALSPLPNPNRVPSTTRLHLFT